MTEILADLSVRDENNRHMAHTRDASDQVLVGDPVLIRDSEGKRHSAIVVEIEDNIIQFLLVQGE